MTERAATWPEVAKAPFRRVRKTDEAQSLDEGSLRPDFVVDIHDTPEESTQTQTGVAPRPSPGEDYSPKDGPSYLARLRTEVGDEAVWSQYFTAPSRLKDAMRVYCANIIDSKGKHMSIDWDPGDTAQCVVAINPDLPLILKIGARFRVDPAFFVKFTLGRRSSVRGKLGFWYTLDVTPPGDRDSPVQQFITYGPSEGQVWIFVPYESPHLPVILVKYTEERDSFYRESWKVGILASFMRLAVSRVAAIPRLQARLGSGLAGAQAALETPLLEAEDGLCASLYQFLVNWLQEVSHVQLLCRLPWPEDGPVTQAGTVDTIMDLCRVLDLDICVHTLGKFEQETGRLAEATITDPNRDTFIRLSKCRSRVIRLQRYVRDIGPASVPDVFGWAVGKPRGFSRERWWAASYDNGSISEGRASSIAVRPQRSMRSKRSPAISQTPGRISPDGSRASAPAHAVRNRSWSRDSSPIPSTFTEWTTKRVERNSDLAVARLNDLELELEEVFKLLSQALTVADSETNTRQARRATFLTLLAVIYLPATLATGIMGMNISEISNELTAPTWRHAVYVWLALIGITGLFIILRVVARVRRVPRWVRNVLSLLPYVTYKPTMYAFQGLWYFVKAFTAAERDIIRAKKDQKLHRMPR